MSASILIIFASSALFVYWFRYVCLLILDQRVGSEDTAKAAATGQFQFRQVQRELESEKPAVALGALHTSLDRDYKMLCGLLAGSADGDSIERTILSIDYRLMSLLFRATSSRFPNRARKALGEMAGIVSYFAAEAGQGAQA